ncbi:unnamed protein product [Clavelina lepadiformis]|uniref:PKD/REJ-like domain-containing protein n=1 Tax=Clavelina lepadiformis TaxID=159417 RepID=A0ABP0FHA3_CLALP
MWFMRFLQVGLAVTFMVGCAECSVLLTNASGKIEFPTAKECVNDVMSAGAKSWKIQLKKGEAAYLQFDEVLFSCAKADLNLISEKGKMDLNCIIRKPHGYPNFVFEKNVTITMERYTTKCSEANISFVYNRIGFRLMTTSTHVQTGQKVQFVATLTGAEGLKLDCDISYNEKNETDFSTKTLTAERSFKYPGKYLVFAKCFIGGRSSSQTFKTPDLFLYVEDFLSASKLQISLQQNNFDKYPASTELIFHHKYYFPISYALMVDDVIITELQTSQTFDKKKILSNEAVRFELNSTMQRLVGPGKHDVILLLQNHVSSVTYSEPVIFYEEIKNLTVMTEQYVGLRPNVFVINVTVSSGAPVNVAIDIISTRTSLSVFRSSKFCPRDCHTMAIEATLPQAGIYEAVATATNNISELTSSASFEALPQIHDVYITSRGFEYETRREVFILIRGDVGKYEMNLTIGENAAKNLTLTISKTKYKHVGLPNLPFDAEPYMLITNESLFDEARQVVVLIRNEKQSFRFIGNVPKALPLSCLESVRIRDGKIGGGLDEPLKVVEELVLSVDLNFRCTRELFSVDYKWRAYRVTSKIDIPKIGDEVQLKTSSGEPELVIKADDLLPGMYVIKVNANVTSDERLNVIEKGDDYTLVEIPKRKLNFLIKGGNVVEAGMNTNISKFESSIDFNKHEGNIKRDWFCAVTQEDLPMTKEIGKIQRKGSCFGWQTLYVTGDDVMEISMDKLVRSDRYYVRLIVSGPHYDETFADQTIVLKSTSIPNVTLRRVLQKFFFLLP